LLLNLSIIRRNTLSFYLDSTEVDAILKGWDEIENTTCIRLRPRLPTEKDYVFIQRGSESSGCFSSVGRQIDRQVKMLRNNCLISFILVLYDD